MDALSMNKIVWRKTNTGQMTVNLETRKTNMALRITAVRHVTASLLGYGAAINVIGSTTLVALGYFHRTLVALYHRSTLTVLPC